MRNNSFFDIFIHICRNIGNISKLYIPSLYLWQNQSKTFDKEVSSSIQKWLYCHSILKIEVNFLCFWFTKILTKIEIRISISIPFKNRIINQSQAEQNICEYISKWNNFEHERPPLVAILEQRPHVKKNWVYLHHERENWVCSVFFKINRHSDTIYSEKMVNRHFFHFPIKLKMNMIFVRTKNLHWIPTICSQHVVEIINKVCVGKFEHIGRSFIVEVF